jgi:hypothetical protein
MSKTNINDPLYTKYLERMNRNPDLKKKCIYIITIAEELSKYLEKDTYLFKTLPIYLWLAGILLLIFAIICTYLIIEFFEFA